MATKGKENGIIDVNLSITKLFSIKFNTYSKVIPEYLHHNTTLLLNYNNNQRMGHKHSLQTMVMKPMPVTAVTVLNPPELGVEFVAGSVQCHLKTRVVKSKLNNVKFQRQR